MMSEDGTTADTPAPRIVINVGCGPAGGARLPAFFSAWRQIRVDVDPAVEPDVVASATDLSAFAAGSAAAIWSAHCIEHLYAHDVTRALAEFHRVLAEDGFACIIVPDLQTIAQYIVADRLHDVLYTSPAGPVTAHDVLFGFGPALAQGRASMAHRCGFTPTVMLRRLDEARFAEIVLRRRPSLELAAVARKRPSLDAAARDALLAGLEL
jgi:SAM-dependent methyltransferase